MAAVLQGSNRVGQVSAPGDFVADLPATGQVTVGSGVQAAEASLLSSKAGLVRCTRAGKVWIDTKQKRYVPAVEESVIGIITERYGDAWNLDINGPYAATLPALAFEGVTRRNRPNLHAGDLVFAKVTSAPRDAETELTCVLATGKGGGFGHLKDGLLTELNLQQCRQLLAQPPCPLLAALGAKVAFELVVGQNGRAWVKAASAKETVLVASALQSAGANQVHAQQVVGSLQQQQQQRRL